MRIDAIGAGGSSTAALTMWADLIKSGRVADAGLDRLVAVATSDSSSLSEVLGAIASSGLEPSTQVQLSDAASALFAMDAQDGSAAPLGELAQALLIALILQLLDTGAA